MRRMPSSAESMHFWSAPIILYTHDTSRPIPTPPTVPHAGNIPRAHSSYPPSPFLMPSQISSLTLTPLGPTPKMPSGGVIPIRPLPLSSAVIAPQQIQSLMPTSSVINSAGGSITGQVQRPHPYRRGLAPKPSPLRPHVLARDRLRLWRPLAGRSAAGSGLPPSDGDILRIFTVLTSAWTEGTAESYGSGLLSFHVFCDSKCVPELARAPAAPTLIAGYISALAGFLSGGTISNYVSGVRAWHILHGVAWAMNMPELETLLRAADRLTPLSSKRDARMPYTPNILCSLRPHFDLTKHLDASVWSCLTTLFWGTSRGGEFTVKTLTSFDPTVHIKPCDVTEVTDRNGLNQTNFFIPRTKSAPHGENAYWAEQNGAADPKTAFANHIAVNAPPANGALFAYIRGHTHRPLTKTAFKKRLTEAFKAAGVDFIHVHGIRMEYLLRGVPFDVMKAKGRWASDAFTIYLRRHAEIMAPYMQAEPQLHANVLRIIMPRVR
ncbi:hypothetical protein C8R46DRAFT_390106 [Mycena filopes]|nr:hypothetical protein C8R46DRAFT_390106 [Mycena filopes]